jgi:hypothetical protein
MTDFFAPGNIHSKVYSTFADINTPQNYINAHHFIESMWLRYEPYADTHFLTEVKQSDAKFYQRFWEMYLACSLMEREFSIESDDEGPDICMAVEGRKVWFEAIVPTKGEGENAFRIDSQTGPAQGEGEDEVPILETNVDATKLRPEKIQLRYCSAVKDKYSKYKKYLEKEILSSTDFYIIAINGSWILSPFGKLLEEDGIPQIIKSVLPIGHSYIKISESGEDVIEQGYTYQNVIVKDNSSEVHKDVFFDEAYAGISAILFSYVDAINHPENFGDDFILIHNPLARNKLPQDFIKAGQEYWVENSDLKFKDHCYQQLDQFLR